MNTVNKPFRKKDAMQLVTGQPVYMDRSEEHTSELQSH